MSRVGQHVLYDVRMAMFDHLQKLSLSFYNRYSVGRVITRVINDVGTLREFITWAVLAIVRNLLAIIGMLDRYAVAEFAPFPSHLYRTASHGFGDHPIPPGGAAQLSQSARSGLVDKFRAGGECQWRACGAGVLAPGA